METRGPTDRHVRFRTFEFDLKTLELHNRGRKVAIRGHAAKILAALLENPGEVVTRTELRKRLWPDDTFVDWEHILNNSINKLREAFGDEAGSPRYIQTVPGLGYRFIASVDQPATATSTPIAAPAAITGTGSRRHLWIAVTASVILIAILAPFVGTHPLAARLFHRDTASPINSIAVLPLDNLSGDPNQEYFADGMTDELITMLAKDSTLRITSRTSVMRFKSTRQPLPEIAHELGVDAILEGSVERFDNQVHMTLQLIRGDTDAHLWADSYYRDKNEGGQLPGEAARQIARYLHKASSVAASVGFVNPDAHDAYLRGRYLWFRYQNGEAGKYFRKAAELQPDSALAWTGLASYFGVGAIGGYQDPRLSIPQLKSAALRATQLDDSLPEAHLSLGMAYLCEWNIHGAQSEIDRAVELNPSLAEAYHLRTRIDTAINHNAQAIEAQRRAMELDPFERPWGMVWAFKTVRQYDAAIQEAQQRLEALPNDDALWWELGQVYDRMGERDKAVQAWEKMELSEGHTSNATTIRSVYQRRGWTGLIKRFIAEGEKESGKSYVSPFDLARYHAQLSEREQTLSLLDEAYRQHSPQLLWIQTDPAFDFLHNDPRYRALVQRIGLPTAY